MGMKRAFPTYIHLSAREYDTVFISAGVRGLQLRISPDDLAGFVGATFAAVSSKP